VTDDSSHLRTARRTDLPTLLELQSALGEPSPTLLRAGVSGVGVVLVSVAAGRPVGYLLAVSGEETAHVAELVVEPAHRREGRATALLDTLTDREDVDRLTVRVTPGNDAAMRCYRAVGFETVGRDPDGFTDGPALVLARSV
jgi:ribosomal-protein-alanine N-acetyltransferase